MVSSAQRFSRGMSVLLAMLTILAAEDAAAFVNVPAFSTSPAPRLRAPRSLSPSSVGMMAEGGGPSEATNNNALDMVVSRRSALRAALAASIVAASVTVPGSKFLGQAEPATAAESDPLGYATGYNVAPGKKVVLPDGTVETSALDRRKYRALTLPNGLRVLLASDPKADNTAAALDVHVGHFSDPAEIPGLAHFCEHMLFLGTDKYPVEGDLDNFLSLHGGSSNAFTASEDTCYYFSLSQEQLEPALDRFSRFFVAPLFTAAATDRELNAIESEHAKNLQQDSWRMDQVSKLRFNPDHPASKFGTGNKFTLKEGTKAQNIDLRTKLLEFHGKYYSANQMTLAVCGRDDLDTLEKWVTSKFSDVPNADVPPPEAAWAGKIPPIDVKEAAKTAYNIVPVIDERSVEIEWVIPYTSKADREDRLYAKPQVVIASLIGHEGKGSLLSYLKNEKGLVTALGAAVFEDVADYITFGVSIELTSEGLKRKDEVLTAVFDYLDLIRDDKIPEYFYTEPVKMAETFFRFRETGGPAGFVESAAGNMHHYSPDKYVSGPSLYKGITKGQVKNLLDQMTPEAVLISTVARDLAPLATSEERWYKARYGVQPATKIVPKGETARNGQLLIPPPNPFIPTDFSLKSQVAEQISDPIAPPKMLVDSPTWRVHFKPDRRYGQPKGIIFIQIAQPDTVFGTGTTPRTSALARLLKTYLTDFLREDTYAASTAGLGYAYELTSKGIRLTFSGFSDKLPAFATTVAAKIAAFVPQDEAKLERYKDQISRDLAEFVNQQPYQKAGLFARLCTDAPSYLPPDVMEELKGVTFKELQEWTRKLWTEGFGEALVQGNFEEREALELMRKVEDSFQFKAVPPEKRATSTVVELPIEKDGYGLALIREELNPSEVNSAVMVQFQNPNQDLKNQMAMLVIAAIIEQPFYQDLRTKQQLGYIVFASYKADEGARSVFFTVQSAVADAAALTDKVFSFVDGAAAKLVSEMTQEAFSAFVEGLVTSKLQKDKTLGAEAGRHWDEIAEGEYKYDREELDVAALRGLTLDFVKDLYARVIKVGGAARRPLTAVVYATGQQGAKTLPEGTELIADARTFRKSRPVIIVPKAAPPPLAKRA